MCLGKAVSPPAPIPQGGGGHYGPFNGSFRVVCAGNDESRRYQKHTIVCVHHPVRFGIILHYSVQTHKSCSVSSTDTYSAVWNFTHENTSTSTETKQIKERYGMLYSVCTKCQRICPLGRIDSYKLKSGQDSKVRRQHTAFEEVLDQMIEYQHIYLYPTVLMAPSPPPLPKDPP